MLHPRVGLLSLSLSLILSLTLTLTREVCTPGSDC